MHFGEHQRGNITHACMRASEELDNYTHAPKMRVVLLRKKQYFALFPRLAVLFIIN